MYLTTWEVRGSMQFPLDMLRYDRCHPVSSGDVDGLTSEPGYPEYTTERRVRLGSYHAAPQAHVPTAQRWASFLWPVVAGSVRTARV